MTWTRWTISRGSRHASAPPRAPCWQRCTWGRPRERARRGPACEGRCPLGRRGRRTLPARAGGCRRAEHCFHHRQRLRTTSKCSGCTSPPTSTAPYALAGLADEERGWGRSDESWRALETVRALGGEAWFLLGDRDLGLHLVRTQLLREGLPLSEVTGRLARELGLAAALLPASDAPVRTFVETRPGPFPSRPGSWRGAIATRSMRFTTRAQPRRPQARASWRRSPRPT